MERIMAGIDPTRYIRCIKAVLLAVVLWSVPVLAQRGYPRVIEGAKEIVYKKPSGTKLQFSVCIP
jgi:hypothetical protein